MRSWKQFNWSELACIVCNCILVSLSKLTKHHYGCSFAKDPHALRTGCHTIPGTLCRAQFVTKHREHLLTSNAKTWAPIGGSGASALQSVIPTPCDLRNPPQGVPFLPTLRVDFTDATALACCNRGWFPPRHRAARQPKRHDAWLGPDSGCGIAGRRPYDRIW